LFSNLNYEQKWFFGCKIKAIYTSPATYLDYYFEIQLKNIVFRNKIPKCRQSCFSKMK